MLLKVLILLCVFIYNFLLNIANFYFFHPNFNVIFLVLSEEKLFFNICFFTLFFFYVRIHILFYIYSYFSWTLHWSSVTWQQNYFWKTREHQKGVINNRMASRILLKNIKWSPLNHDAVIQRSINISLFIINMSGV